MLGGTAGGEQQCTALSTPSKNSNSQGLVGNYNVSDVRTLDKMMNTGSGYRNTVIGCSKQWRKAQAETKKGHKLKESAENTDGKYRWRTLTI